MASDLQFNKYAGAVLATSLGILGLRELSRIVFEAEPPEKMGYAIAIPETAEGGGAAADRLIDWGTVLTSAVPADGATVSKKCASCHNFERGGANGTGPNLWGVMGGAIAAKAGYAYSPALREHAAAAKVWSYDEMDAFLRAPSRHVPGTKMTFVGLKKEDERINLIAYLRSMTDAPPPIPAPDPARQEGAAGTGGGPPADGASAASPVEGAAGVVPSPAGGTTGTPATGAGGGMAGQTPIYGQPGQAPQAMQVSPGGEEGGRGQGSSSPGGGGTTNRAGVTAGAAPATNPQARNPTAQPAPSTRAPSRGGPGRVNEGNTNSASPGQPR